MVHSRSEALQAPPTGHSVRRSAPHISSHRFFLLQVKVSHHKFPPEGFLPQVSFHRFPTTHVSSHRFASSGALPQVRPRPTPIREPGTRLASLGASFQLDCTAASPPPPSTPPSQLSILGAQASTAASSSLPHTPFNSPCQSRQGGPAFGVQATAAATTAQQQAIAAEQGGVAPLHQCPVSPKDAPGPVRGGPRPWGWQGQQLPCATKRPAGQRRGSRLAPCAHAAAAAAACPSRPAAPVPRSPHEHRRLPAAAAAVAALGVRRRLPAATADAVVRQR